MRLKIERDKKAFGKIFFCLALRLEGRLLKKAFSKNQDSRLTKKRDEIEREIKEIAKEIKEIAKNNEKPSTTKPAERIAENQCCKN